MSLSGLLLMSCCNSKTPHRPAHHTANGFQNPWLREQEPGFGDMIKWQRTSERESLPDTEELEYLFPIVSPDWEAIRNPGAALQVTWVGHATLLIQMDGVNILTDPMFSERCSPFRFTGPKRYRPLPFPVDSLPPIDLILISHDHYDHLDRQTVRALGNAPRWLVPLGLKKWFHKQGLTNVQEKDWWDEVVYKDLTIVCTPARHFSGRAPFNRNRTLWCSWTVLGMNHRIHFTGDTGYCPVFKEIGTKYGPFDLAAIPIGTYAPRWFMQSSHVTPVEAVQINKDLQAKRLIATHFGTFILADNPVGEPPILLKQAITEAGLKDREFILPRHGETFILP
ncbi:MBL fold metallo-hydrolase [candidate division KSB1 bacterium]|nr:MBL fold metallo-hydrolase [candidate division KSB1 bacterium]